jgi:pimeloyl-ACP methyl ester carboxylesterase
MIGALIMTTLVSATAAQGAHLEVNGVAYSYDVRGSGAPILLLHGGLMSSDAFAPIMPLLTAKHQVITIDLQGHGRTTLGTRPMTYEGMGADVAAIIKKIGIAKVDVIGYSMGAGVGLNFALQHPELVRKLVLVSCSLTDQDAYPEIRAMAQHVNAAAAEQMKGSPMYAHYTKLAPNPADFPRLLDAIGALMLKHYDYTAKVAKLTMPIELIYGDSDMFTLESMVKFYKAIGGGQRDPGWQKEHMAQNRLAILPGVTHYDMGDNPEMAKTALAFIDMP